MIPDACRSAIRCRYPRLAVGAAVLLIPVAVLAMGQFPGDDSGVIAYKTTAPTDAIARLQKQIDAGTVKLTFDPQHGYLPSVLQALDIPPASQGLVFSKTSLQVDHIAPWTPRAIYFNDEVYVGWVQGGPIMEVASADPKLGAVFYTLDQRPSADPQFKRRFTTCLQCHDSSSSTGGVPGFIMRSTFVDRLGYPVSTLVPQTTDQTPLSQRWGGWYVTGTTGPLLYPGNITAPVAAHDIDDPARSLAQIKLGPNVNLTSLTGLVDTRPYLRPTSDVVALMVLAHQTYVHDLITIAGYQTRKALYDEQLQEIMNGSKPAGGGHLPSTTVQIDGIGEQLVRAMLFVHEAPFDGPIRGNSRFAVDFMSRGPRDRQGRSLRDFDLKTRLFKYPLSYLIYSDSFNALPDIVKEYVYRRLRQVLTGEDRNPDFDSLSAADRQAILQILDETKPDFAAMGRVTTAMPARP